MSVGIDIDNTIICYDNVLHKVACDMGFIAPSLLVDKQTIRNVVRKSHGDEAWQKLQVEIYGVSIEKADLSEGVWDFLMSLKSRGIPFQLVSHKTQYPNYGDVKVDLRKAALKFLENNNFFSNAGLGLSLSDVFFLSTRMDKVAKIKDLGHRFFIDDLEEVFAEPDFPKGVHKLLYSPKVKSCCLADVKSFSSFEEVRSYFFEVFENDLP